MKLRNIPTDIAISLSFVAAFLLALVPSWLLIWSPDLLLAIKTVRNELRGKPPKAATPGKAD
jgi:hypothetical protein